MIQCSAENDTEAAVRSNFHACVRSEHLKWIVRHLGCTAITSSKDTLDGSLGGRFFVVKA